MTLSAVAAVAVAVTVAVPVKENEAENVDNESGDADVEHPVGVLDDVSVGQSLDRLDKNGETESNKKHRVDERTEHLRSSPAVRVLVGVHL